MPPRRDYDIVITRARLPAGAGARPGALRRGRGRLRDGDERRPLYRLDRKPDRAILPAVIRAQRDGAEDLPAASVQDDVECVVAQLRSSRETLTEPFEREQIDIVAAVYDLDDGEVRFSA